MHTRLQLVFRRILYNLRGGFLVRPLTIALALGCAGALLSWMEEAVPAFGAWVPAPLFPSRADPQVAQIILGGIAASIMTVVSIVFAILLMTLTLASMQFSPRIIVSFVKDRVTQWTLGMFLGTFLYCIAALPAARSLPHPFAPVATVAGAILLAIACVGWLLFFIHHISRAISVNYIVDRIASETEAMVNDLMPWPHRPHHLDQAPPQPDWEAAVTSDVSGYIRFVDSKRLVSLAKAHRVRIKVLRRVGHFVPAEVALLMVSRADRLSAELAVQLRAAFDFGPSRTLQQDVEFGILQIVDIALKAISPAVNDPTTAISCIDQLARLLIRLASREPLDQLYYDPPGTLRVVIPWPGFEDLLNSAFEQIRMYAKGDIAVSLRLLRALRDIAGTTAGADHRQALLELGRRVIDGCAEKVAPEEVTGLRARAADLEAFLAVQPAAATTVYHNE